MSAEGQLQDKLQKRYSSEAITDGIEFFQGRTPKLTGELNRMSKLVTRCGYDENEKGVECLLAADSSGLKTSEDFFLVFFFCCTIEQP